MAFYWRQLRRTPARSLPGRGHAGSSTTFPRSTDLGLRYLGAVASGAPRARPGGGVADTVVLGDNMNITARLSSTAKTGEALISEATCAAAGLDCTQWEQRQLELKGKSEGVGVRVLTADHTL
jgi:class 3 adenylate cyclase